jgi:hypothetical protein
LSPTRAVSISPLSGVSATWHLNGRELLCSTWSLSGFTVNQSRCFKKAAKPPKAPRMQSWSDSN